MELFLTNKLSALETMDPRTTAILGVHWQVDVVKREGALGIFADVIEESGVVDRTVKLIEAGRRAGMLVAFINVVYRPGYTDLIRNNALFNSVPVVKASIRGTPGAAVIPEMTPTDKDFIIEHTRLGSFYGTDLESILRKHDIKTVIVTGIATNVAVEQTVREAIQIGYDTVLLEDCCCTSNATYHDASLLTMRILATQVTTADAVLKVLK